MIFNVLQRAGIVLLLFAMFKAPRVAVGTVGISGFGRRRTAQSIDHERKLKSRRIFLAGFCIVSVLQVASMDRPCLAQSVPLVNVDPVTDCPGGTCFFEQHSNATWGWTFYVTAPIQVTDVGWYDQSADGLSHSHAIGLWKDVTGNNNWPYITGAGQQLFGSSGILIPSATSAPLDGPWRKVPIPSGPITLQSGGYALGGVDNSNSTDGIRYMKDGNGVPVLPRDPRIIVGAPGNSQLTGFQQPTQFFLVWGVEFGPTLFVTPVPEPATISLLGFALAALYIGNRHRR